MSVSEECIALLHMTQYNSACHEFFNGNLEHQENNFRNQIVMPPTMSVEKRYDRFE